VHIPVIAATHRYKLSQHARLALGKESGVLLDVALGKYYSLTPSAALIVSAISPGRSIDEVIENLTGVFDVSQSRLEADLRSFLSILQSKGLCHVTTR
jgi:hypothetical protein